MNTRAITCSVPTMLNVVKLFMVVDLSWTCLFIIGNFALKYKTKWFQDNTTYTNSASLDSGNLFGSLPSISDTDFVELSAVFRHSHVGTVQQSWGTIGSGLEMERLKKCFGSSLPHSRQLPNHTYRLVYRGKPSEKNWARLGCVLSYTSGAWRVPLDLCPKFLPTGGPLGSPHKRRDPRTVIVATAKPRLSAFIAAWY